MSDIGVVLRVSKETHSKLKNACAKHDRSMQKIVLSLIENWVANGSPDPTEDKKKLSKEVQVLICRVKSLEGRMSRLEMHQDDSFFEGIL